MGVRRWIANAEDHVDQLNEIGDIHDVVTGGIAFDRLDCLRQGTVRGYIPETDCVRA